MDTVGQPQPVEAIESKEESSSEELIDKSRPKKRRKLTYKQRLFIQEYIKTKGNATQSALRVYNTSSPEVAHAIGGENLRKPTIQYELLRIATQKGLTLEESIALLKRHTESKDGHLSIKALNLFYEIIGAKHIRIEGEIKHTLAQEEEKILKKYVDMDTQGQLEST